MGTTGPKLGDNVEVTGLSEAAIATVTKQIGTHTVEVSGGHLAPYRPQFAVEDLVPTEVDGIVDGVQAEAAAQWTVAYEQATFIEGT